MSNTMQSPTQRIRGIALALGLSTALAVGALPALADNSVTQSVTPGSMTASVTNLGLTPAAYSQAVQASTGNMTLTADDSTGSGAGWNVTILTSDFVYSGANSGTDIPAVGFSLTSAAAPTMTAGQAVDGTNGPKVPSTSPVGTLDSARKVAQASSGFGLGTYTQVEGVSLVIPAQSRAGTYTGTLTTTISTAP